MSATMDDRDGFIWVDGKLAPWREVRMHVLTHALHYGSAVFEGERIYDGRVFRLAAHSARLINSARLLDYELAWTREQIDEATRAVVKANKLQQGYIRPIAWRGSEVLGVSGIGTSVHLAIAPWDQEGKLSVQARDSGINVTMAKYRRPSPETAPGHAKVAGLYVICGIEKDRALKAGFDARETVRDNRGGTRTFNFVGADGRGSTAPAAVRPASRTTTASPSSTNSVCAPLLVMRCAVAVVSKPSACTERMRAWSISTESVSGRWRASSP